MSLFKNSKAINQVKEVTRDDPPLPSTLGNASCFLLEEPVRSMQDSRWGTLETHSLYPLGTCIKIKSVEIMHVLYSSGGPCRDESKCFPSHRKKYCPHLERFHPMDISFIFFQYSSWVR